MATNEPIVSPEIYRHLLSILNHSANSAGIDLEQLPEARWHQVVQLAIRQGLAPLLYRRLAEINLKAVPPHLYLELRQCYTENAFKNLELYRELHRILNGLQKDEIPVIVLKGAHLAQTVYGDVALRQMNDIDLLVSREDLAGAEKLLSDWGYSLYTVTADRNWYESNHFHFHYLHHELGVRVELHWDIVPPDFPLNLDLKGLWERSETAMIAGIHVQVLSPEDLLLYLCLHLSLQFTYNYYALRSLYDIALVILHYQDRIDWRLLQERTGQWGAANATYLTLRLAQKILGAAIPSETLEGFEPDGFDARFLGWAEERVFAEVGRDEGSLRKSSMSNNFEHVWSSRRLKDKINISSKIFFPPRGDIAQRYTLSHDTKRIYFYYLVRWKELVQQHARRSWLLLRRDPEVMQWAERERRRIALVTWLMPTQ